MTQGLEPKTNVIIWGLDPLECLTALDGILRSIYRIAGDRYRLIGIADDSHQSAVILSLMFHDIMILSTEGDARIEEFIARISSVSGPKVLITANDASSALMKTHQNRLKEAGILFHGPYRHHIFTANNLSFLQEELAIDTVQWQEISDLSELDEMENDMDFPLVMTCSDHAQKWIAKDFDMLKVLARTCFNQADTSVKLRPFCEETAYQVSSVIGNHSTELGWGCVREIAADDESEPWMFLSVSNESLLAAGRKVIHSLHVKGPVTMRFLRFHKTNEYLLDSISFTLPVWLDLAAAGGVNLAEQLIRSLCGTCEPSDPLTVPHGSMIVFNSFDIPISSDKWLQIAGNGGFNYEK
jgi:hypothetical protein